MKAVARRETFEEAFDELHRVASRAAGRVLREPSVAEDAVAETLVSGVRSVAPDRSVRVCMGSSGGDEPGDRWLAWKASRATCGTWCHLRSLGPRRVLRRPGRRPASASPSPARSRRAAPPHRSSGGGRGGGDGLLGRCRQAAHQRPRRPARPPRERRGVSMPGHEEDEVAAPTPPSGLRAAVISEGRRRTRVRRTRVMSAVVALGMLAGLVIVASGEVDDSQRVRTAETPETTTSAADRASPPSRGARGGDHRRYRGARRDPAGLVKRWKGAPHTCPGLRPVPRQRTDAVARRALCVLRGPS